MCLIFSDSYVIVIILERSVKHVIYTQDIVFAERDIQEDDVIFVLQDIMDTQIVKDVTAMLVDHWPIQMVL